MNVIVHGGAGSTPEEPTARRAELEGAADNAAGADTPVEAVVTAVRRLEASPRFNAGIGGAVQSDGTIRTDAGIMSEDRSAGAACAMPGVCHAVSVARTVMEETPHVLLAGERAVEFAADYGIDTGVDLWSEHTRERWSALSPPSGDARQQAAWVRERFDTTDDDPDVGERGSTSHDPPDHDTVGAVAVEGGSMAAATSTGGRWLALAGRVGDVPQIGSGFYCTPAGGASATGAGEDIARTTLSRRAVECLEAGLNAADAADRVIEEFGDLTASESGSTAGIIVCDAAGGLGSAYNSDGMQTARARMDSER